MLDPKELRIVLNTLTTKRGLLAKSIENPDLDAKTKEDHIATMKLLDSSLVKLAKLAPKPVPAKPSPPIPPQSRKPKVRGAKDPKAVYALIADDSEDSRNLLKGILEDIGIHKIDCVGDGRATQLALQNCSPPFDLVLCDWEMPGQSGLDAYRSVRTLAKLQDTYFIMVTGMTDKAHIREAIQLGIDDYLGKPIDTEVFTKKIKAVLMGNEPPPHTP
jgi:two-component system, chemotaxis family, chemotaxis protein CheY